MIDTKWVIQRCVRKHKMVTIPDQYKWVDIACVSGTEDNAITMCFDFKNQILGYSAFRAVEHAL